MKFCKYLFLFVFGGGTYYAIEMFSRGYSHWTMFVLGGVCFILCGILNEWQAVRFTLLQQMVLSMLMITFLELSCGVILNMWLKLNIWDYSRVPLNVYGQICLPYACVWFGLSAVAIVADDYLRFWFYGEQRPVYRFF
jgi:uncharacterized membrane protein